MDESSEESKHFKPELEVENHMELIEQLKQERDMAMHDAQIAKDESKRIMLKLVEQEQTASLAHKTAEQHLQSKLEASQQSNYNLNMKCEESEASYKKARERNSSYFSMMASLEKQICSYKKKLQTSDSKVKELEEQISNYKDIQIPDPKVKEIETQLAALKTKEILWGMMESSLQATIKGVEQRCASANLENTRLEAEAQKARVNLSYATLQASALTRQMQKLEQLSKVAETTIGHFVSAIQSSVAQNTTKDTVQINNNIAHLIKYLECVEETKGINRMLEVLYEVQPPLKKDQIIKTGDLKKALKKALLLYHPDKQAAGDAWCVAACAEIAKLLNQAGHKLKLEF
jgi:chromosome segregation ATPase